MFSFGRNWQRFLAQVGESQIARARESFTTFTRLSSLQGQAFLDVGCGSGLSSLVAHQLGAERVVSVDIDQNSVNCALDLRTRFAKGACQWEILQGSALDRQFMSSLGRFSYVYSWGVVHHTGAMWSALENVSTCVESGGTLHVAIYNEHKHSPVWRRIKRMCNQWPRTVFPVLKASYVLLVYAQIVARFQSPLEFRMRYGKGRGMDFFRDVDDWLCGLPYEYCRPERVIDFLLERGFALLRLRTTGSIGCNEFLFKTVLDANDRW